MTSLCNVAVLGATGIVGKTIISILEDYNFPINKLYPLASSRSSGSTVKFHNEEIEVLDVEDFDFHDVQIGIFSAGSEASKAYAPKATQNGCVVIDNTSHYRYEKDIPLVIPEVNPNDIAKYTNKNIISNPNCSTIQMLVALKPIYDAVGIDRINVCTYQSVSGSGNMAVSELTEQTGQTLSALDVQPNIYPKQIAFNVLPHIDVFLDNGYTKEEMKMVWETQKILNDKNIKVNATTVRVPVYNGHSEAVCIETKHLIDASQVRKLYKNARGVKLIDNVKDNEYPTPKEHGDGTDYVYVGRVRKDISHPRGINLWIVADNVRKGAALNSVQIAKILKDQYL